jgi:hypothetical protein
MTISIDWQNKLVLSTASITDIVAFKDQVRDLEDDDVGILYDPVITYKRLDLGGGAYFHGIEVVNGYQLKFPNPGNYTVVGNIGATIVPVAGVFVDRTKSAAFATVAGTGGSGGATAADIWAYGTRELTSTVPTAAEIATAVLAQLMATTIPANMVQVKGQTINGAGTEANPWGP